MAVTYNTLVTGSSVALENGFIGWSSIVLVESDGTRILYDCGHHVTRTALIASLKACNLEPGDIDILFLSHLHFDHVLNFDLFPKARVMVSKLEWAYADDPHENDVFVPGFIKKALELTDLEIFSGTPELAPGVATQFAPGHTPGLYGLAFEVDKQRIIIAGDAIKTAHELYSGRAAMEFDPELRGASTISSIRDNADRIVPGHYPEFRKTGDKWIWDDPQPLSIVFR
jgi:N-acyl homoserine lactone hydrolase